MAKLNFMDRENLLREMELDEELLTIGREATNKLVIADPSVSRQHAWVEKREDGFYLVDKNSSNGSYVNGKKVTQQKLSHNDKVQLGNAQLVFEDEEQVQATFILPREGLQLGEPSKTQADSVPLSPDERPTSAVDVSSPTPPPAAAKPQPAPTPPPTPAPAPAPPPPPAASVAPPPKVEAPTVCPSCKKPAEPGARFCGFCGAQIPAAPAPKPFTPPPPAPPPPAVAPKPPSPPPPAHQPMPPKPAPAPAPPPPAPSYGGPPHPLTHGFQPQPAPGLGPERAGHQEYAGFGIRFVAYLIDLVISNLLMLLPGVLIYFAITNLNGALQTIVSGVAYLAIFLIAFFYWVVLLGKKGYTPGKKMMKLKVVGADGTYPIGIGKAFLRVIMQSIGGSICGLTYWMILFDKEMHRSLHDKVAGTLVVRET